jgi:hypothetical protein
VRFVERIFCHGGILKSLHFLPRGRKRNQKKTPMSRALRVRLRVVAAIGRAGTRPAYRGAQTAVASLSIAATMLGRVTKGNKTPQKTSVLMISSTMTEEHAALKKGILYADS